MTFDVSATPYSPNLVPQARQDTDPGESLRDLERFLSEEFERIETAMLFVPVQAAYGAILVSPGPAADQPLTKDVPETLDGFNAFSPAVPNRVGAIAGVGADRLQVEEAGVFWVQAQLTVTVDPNTSYTITVAVNLTLGDLFGAVDVGNQTSLVTITFYGLAALQAGDVLTLVAVATSGAPGPFTFIMESATFSAVRVSELHKGD